MERKNDLNHYVTVLFKSQAKHENNVPWENTIN